MTYFIKLFSTALMACSLLYFTSAAYAHNCEGRIVNDSSGPATVYISNASGGQGTFYVAKVSSSQVKCTPLNNSASALSCTIPNKNAGLTFIFSHTHNDMKLFINIGVKGKKSSQTEFGGTIDYPLGNPVCYQGDLQLSNPICVSGVCAKSMGYTNNIQIYDD